MEDNMSIAYAEVFEILGYMDKELVMKIPIELLQVFKNKRSTTFKSKINKNDIFNKKYISKEALHILLWLDFEYWATFEEKQELKKKYIQNDLKKNKEKNEKIQNKKIIKNEMKIEKNDMIIKKESIWNKIKNMLKIFFGE